MTNTQNTPPQYHPGDTFIATHRASDTPAANPVFDGLTYRDSLIIRDGLAARVRLLIADLPYLESHYTDWHVSELWDSWRIWNHLTESSGDARIARERICGYSV